MTQPNARMVNASNRLHSVAFDVTAALEHIQRELMALDWHPANTMSEGGGSHGSEPSRPTERVATARHELTEQRETIRDAVDAVEELIASLAKVCQKTMGMRAPGSQLFDPDKPIVERCNGKVDATCENAASEHRNPETGATVMGLCDACFLAACRVCFIRPGVRSGHRCEGCYKRAQRAATVAA